MTLNTVIGRSVNGGTLSESVAVNTPGTYYVFVHIWQSDGACVNYTIWWCKWAIGRPAEGVISPKVL